MNRSGDPMNKENNFTEFKTSADARIRTPDLQT
jgi:hypothetical protein